MVEKYCGGKIMDVSYIGYGSSGKKSTYSIVHGNRRKKNVLAWRKEIDEQKKLLKIKNVIFNEEV